VGGPAGRDVNETISGLGIPTLETARLVLRPFREEDAATFCELLQDPDVVRYIGDGTIPSPDDCWRAVAAWLGHWALRGYGPWAITDRTSGGFMGRVGIHFPYGWPQPELAYTLGKPYWGRGYATEACRAALDWAFTERDFPALVSYIYPANTASIRVATKVGETPRGTASLRGKEVLRYAITRAEWEAQRAAPETG
jgi:RimJ/RimL family protein N-acetyltransferase